MHEGKDIFRIEAAAKAEVDKTGFKIDDVVDVAITDGGKVLDKGWTIEGFNLSQPIEARLKKTSELTGEEITHTVEISRLAKVKPASDIESNEIV